MSDFDNALEKLTEKKKELLDRLNRINISKQKPHDSDSGEMAIERENDEVVDALGEKIIKEIEQIDDAIYRIGKNVYDVCTVCHNKISIKRLEALPYTNKCINCA